MPQQKCILVELTDGSLHGYTYPDDESAAAWYSECRKEWNVGRTLIFELRRSSVNRFSPTQASHAGDEVSSLRLTTSQDAEQRGAMCRDAVIFA